MSVDGQGTYCRRNIAKNLNRLNRAHERYRRQTGGRATANSERERKFTFANKTHTENVNARNTANMTTLVGLDLFAVLVM